MSTQDRNPSPPADDINEEILHADSIGDTLFSKRWVFSTLMKLLKEVEQEAAGKTAEELIAAKAHGIDIDEELETDICKLWDMTANQDVSNFLHEWKSLDILISVVEQTTAPRLTEICMGIVANMACSKDITAHISNNQRIRLLTLELLGSSDTQTLIQTTRLLSTCLSSKKDEVTTAWLQQINTDFCQKVAFILQSSTNHELLYNMGFIIRALLGLDEALVQDWTDTEQIVSLIEALKQVSSGGKSTREQSRTISLLLSCLEIIIADDDGMENLVSASDTVLPLLADFLWSFCVDEVVTVYGSEGSLASAIYIIEVAMANMEGANDIVDTLLKYPKLLKGAVEIFISLYTEKTSTKNNDPASKPQDPPAEQSPSTKNVAPSSLTSISSKTTENLKSASTVSDNKTLTESNSDSKIKHSDNVPSSSSSSSSNSHNASDGRQDKGGGDEEEVEDREEECKELSENLSSFFIFLLREAGGNESQSHVASLLMTACGEKNLAILRDGMAKAKASPEILQLLQQELIDK
ncbi:protein SAAL1-like [Asterias rubens]|uniref:protein SAAL1-like n=1 Tax=Asterias rubens TaxID=7604 RepID=UPI001455AF26|nr:protein SAAL1-like [Asterias rubens]